MKLKCKCGREGYLRVKWIWGSSHFEKRPYFYIQHREDRPKWCYVGRFRYWRYALSGDYRDMLPNSLKDLLSITIRLDDLPDLSRIGYPPELEAGLKRILIPVLIRLFPNRPVII